MTYLWVMLGSGRGGGGLVRDRPFAVWAGYIAANALDQLKGA
jgi:hypothetical protein